MTITGGGATKKLTSEVNEKERVEVLLGVRKILMQIVLEEAEKFVVKIKVQKS